MKNNKLKHQLNYVVENETNTLKAFVAKEALNSEDIVTFFSDLQQYGCISGMISSLIYYSDTHDFYDAFYDDIEELRTLYEDMIGGPIKIKGDMKNFFAWFAFEETAYRLKNDIVEI